MPPDLNTDDDLSKTTNEIVSKVVVFMKNSRSSSAMALRGSRRIHQKLAEVIAVS